MLALPYNLLERVRILVGKHRGDILEEEFAADITMTLRFPVESLVGFQTDLSELSAGTLQVETIETTEMLLPL
jgi:putative IMPACT (imprinted ancient) family translation regulator